jgi:hypothetical protein
MHLSDDFPKTARLYGVLSNSTEFELVWSEIKPYLLETLEYADGKYNEQDIYDAIKANDMQLWVVYDNGKLLCYCITQIIIFPRKKILSIPFVGGIQMFRWLHLLDLIKQFGREKGCDFAEGYAREGWTKALKSFGFKRSYSIIKAELQE